MQSQHKRIGPYTYNLQDKIGKGNFSTVYKGINTKSGSIIAIKVIALKSLTFAKLQQLLNQQISIITSLLHPNTIKCHQVLTSLNNCYIITELCDHDLSFVLDTKLRFNQAEAMPIIRDVYEGLLYLSSKNVIHRDLKVSNIFMKDGCAKIADFGFAVKSKINFVDASIGSPMYMAPQGFSNHIYGPKTDVWAFGILMFQLTQGLPPSYHCQDQNQLKMLLNTPISQQSFQYTISKDLKKLIIQCLNIDESKRISMKDIQECQFMQKCYSKTHPINFYHRPKTNTLFNPNLRPYTKKNFNELKTGQLSKNYSFQNNIEKKSSQKRNSGRRNSGSIHQEYTDQIRQTHSHSNQINTKQINNNQSYLVVNLFGQKDRNREVKLTNKNEMVQNKLKKIIGNQNKLNNDSKSGKIKFTFGKNSTRIKTQSFSNARLQLLEKNLSAESFNTNKPENLLNGKLSFDECISIIHFCRLCNKYVVILQQTKYYRMQYRILSIRLFKELLQKNSNNNINYETQKKQKLQKKKNKLHQVLIDYIQKYNKNIIENLNKNISLIEYNNLIIQDINILQKQLINTQNWKIVQFYNHALYLVGIMKKSIHLLQNCSINRNYSSFQSHSKLIETAIIQGNKFTYKPTSVQPSNKDKSYSFQVLR